MAKDVSIKDWDEQYGCAVKRYDNYNEYAKHQKSKLPTVTEWVRDYEKAFVPILYRRLRAIKNIYRGDSVLCLGARLGGEVRAFIELGCFAVGIDLNPGEDNLYVLQGDFHNLQFADNSIDIVFSNSLDHILMLDKFIEEIHRVLKVGGKCIIEPVDGLQDGFVAGPYECIVWETIDCLVKQFTDNNFSIVSRTKITYPHYGECIVLRKME